MIRIVGVERQQDPQREFVLLQNQGVMRETLKGHAIAAEGALCGSSGTSSSYFFALEELVPPGAYIMLRTGAGEPKWTRTRDGNLVLNVYMGRTEPIWSNCPGPMHVLKVQHSYVERPSLTLR